MTFGTTQSKPWVETLPTERANFTGRTFSRFHIIDNSGSAPLVGEIWATADHAVESHAHSSDELLYVLSGAIEVNGRKIMANEVVFIPRGASYDARVLTVDGARILRIEFPNTTIGREDSEYEAKVWRGPLTEDGLPRLRPFE